MKAARLNPDDYRTALRRFNDVYANLDPMQKGDLLAYLLDRVEVRAVMEGGKQTATEITIALLGEAPDVARYEKGADGQFHQPPKWLRRHHPGSTGIVVVKVPFKREVRPPSARQQKLRRRAAKRKDREAAPAPAAVALRRAKGWQAEIDAGRVTRADIARRERLTRARVTQIMSLLALPPVTQARLLAGDLQDWSVRRALREVG